MVAGGGGYTDKGGEVEKTTVVPLKLVNDVGFDGAPRMEHQHSASGNSSSADSSLPSTPLDLPFNEQFPRMLRVTRQDAVRTCGTFAAHLDVFLVDRATLHCRRSGRRLAE
jgi:hypothetical protein